MTLVFQSQIVEIGEQSGGPNRYDLVPYAGAPGPGAQCRNLEAIATLFGVPAVPPGSARVLDLGCGMGAGLLPQALEHPTAQFVGCDGAASHIAHIGGVARTLGLQNIELWCRDLRDADRGWGQFDYILCHGVFSWVGPDVRRRILEILRNHLAPNGIAYVSFNALPGWRLRSVARELMCHHSAQFADPQKAIAQARSMLALTAESQADDSLFARLMREEYFSLSHASDAYLFHEMLAEHNQPFYFREFIGQAESVGLQYLSDAGIAQMFTWDLPPAARDFLKPMPLLVREQYLDFLRGSAFRRCLLCHAEVEIDRRLEPSVLRRFSVGLSQHVRVQAPRAGEGEPETSVAGADAARLVIGGCELLSPNPLAEAALRLLDERRPEFVSVQDLLEIASRRVSRHGQSAETAAGSEAGDQQALGSVLRFFMDAVTAGALDAALSPPRLTSRAGERPLLSPLARLHAEQGSVLTNQKQEQIQITDFGRMMARSLDGTRDRQALAELVHRSLDAGLVSLGPLDEIEETRNIDQIVERVLESFGRAALLVA